jgi:hypothetical protein
VGIQLGLNTPLVRPERQGMLICGATDKHMRQMMMDLILANL